jgi:hypothetical protein
MSGPKTKAFPADLTVLACDHVLEQAAPILLVVRDEDDCWQFLCGGEHEDDQCHDIRVGRLVGIDASLTALAGLAAGQYAERASSDQGWQFGNLDP